MKNKRPKVNVELWKFVEETAKKVAKWPKWMTSTKDYEGDRKR